MTPLEPAKPAPPSGWAVRVHDRFTAAATLLQSPFLLLIRLYWGWQFLFTGWGKLHHLAGVITYFGSLGIPFPGLTAPLVACLEAGGGALLVLGLSTRPVGLLLAGNMAVAFLSAEREALAAVFSDPDKFYAAAPYTFLFAAVIVTLFGPGALSLDQLVARFRKR